MAIRTVVWGENIHERVNKVVADIYPKGMHTAIADALNTDKAISATTATLQEPEHGLSESAPGRDRCPSLVGPQGSWRCRGRSR